MTEESEGWLTGSAPGTGGQPPTGSAPGAGTPPAVEGQPGQTPVPPTPPSAWQVHAPASAWSAGAAADAATRPVAYSPAADRRPTWAAAEHDAEQAAPPTPSRWFEPVAEPVRPTRGTALDADTSRRVASGRGGLVAVVVAASLASATLASVGTYGALRASGQLDTQPAATPGAGAQTVATSAPGVTTPGVVTNELSAITTAAAKVSPAIVTITTAAGASTDPFSIPATGVGSGIIFDADGWIITNHHVVEGGDKLTVQLQDKRSFAGTIYGIDTLTDLAIVKVNATGLPTAPIGDSSAAKVGELAIAIGSPLGTYTNSVTSGIVSAFGRQITVQDGTALRNLIQTDAAINPGNSGGALLDSGGNVIGINTAVAQTAEGIGFAIPINIAKPIMQQALAGQKLSRPWIGIRYITIDAQVAADHKLSVTDGAWLKATDPTTGSTVDPIVPDSPAEKADLHEGDIVVAVDGRKITSTAPLDDILTQYAPGKTVALDVIRDGKTITLTLVLGTRPPNL